MKIPYIDEGRDLDDLRKQLRFYLKSDNSLFIWYSKTFDKPSNEDMYLEYDLNINAPISNVINSNEREKYLNPLPPPIISQNPILLPHSSNYGGIILFDNKAGRNQEHLNTWEEILELYKL
jgi:hypothetical protein